MQDQAQRLNDIAIAIKEEAYNLRFALDTSSRNLDLGKRLARESIERSRVLLAQAKELRENVRECLEKDSKSTPND